MCARVRLWKKQKVGKAKANKAKQKKRHEKTAEKNANKNKKTQTTPLERAAHHPNAP